MDNELLYNKQHFFQSIAKASILVLLIWLAFILNDVFSLNLEDWGLRPRNLQGIVGVFSMPFIHSGWEHLLSNTTPLLFLSFGLFYFFIEKSTLILFMMWIICGLLTWIIGRNNIHIGASGLVYALAFFMTTISIIKREKFLMAYTLIIIFLYGSIVWGFFPNLFPDKHISWEGHLSGAITGVILAFFYRKEGPQRKIYFDDEDELDNDDNINPNDDKWVSTTTLNKDL